MHEFSSQIETWLLQAGTPEAMIMPIKGLVFILLLILLSILANWIARHIILAIEHNLIRKSRTLWGDALLEKKVFLRLSHLAPVMVIYWVAPAFMAEFPKMVNFTYGLANLYILFMSVLVLYALLNAVGSIYNHYEISNSRPIKGYLQVTKIIIGLVACIFALSILLNKSPVYLFTGLGAVTAVLMLIFRDTILNFVAGVQVTTNNLVKIGDWIEMPKYGADGDVIDISLHTVTVSNWDRTLTIIPTYALVSDSFKNWRGMFLAGGRRIMRNVYIDISSIKFCDEEMLDRFESAHLLTDYIRNKRKEVEEYNKKNAIDTSVPINGRKLTNIGTFRAYIASYLKHHPKIHKDLIQMVRQMPPGEKGVPLQVYAFVNDVAWVNYEAVQADIFDHILSVASFFDLKIFQFPSQLTIQPAASQVPCANEIINPAQTGNRMA